MNRNQYIHVYCSNQKVRDGPARWNVDLGQSVRATQFELNTVCFDYTFYNINTANSYIKVKDVSGGTIRNISIPIGHYTINDVPETDLCTALKNAINTEYGTTTADVTFDPVTAKITITTDNSHKFWLQGESMAREGGHLLRKLGFPEVNENEGVSVTSHIATNIVNITIGHHLNIYCPQLMSFGTKSINTTMDTGNILCRAPIMQYSFGEQGRVKLDFPFTCESAQTLRFLDFEVRFDDGSIVETNGGSISMHFVFHTNHDQPLIM